MQYASVCCIVGFVLSAVCLLLGWPLAAVGVAYVSGSVGGMIVGLLLSEIDWPETHND